MVEDSAKRCGSLVLIGIIVVFLAFLFFIVALIEKVDIHSPILPLGSICQDLDSCPPGTICYRGFCRGVSGYSCLKNDDCVSNRCQKNVCM